MALHFLQGSKEFMTNTNLFLTLRRKLKKPSTHKSMAETRKWMPLIPSIHTAFTLKCTLSLHSLHKEHALKVGWQRL